MAGRIKDAPASQGRGGIQWRADCADCIKPDGSTCMYVDGWQHQALRDFCACFFMFVFYVPQSSSLPNNNLDLEKWTRAKNDALRPPSLARSHARLMSSGGISQKKAEFLPGSVVQGSPSGWQQSLLVSIYGIAHKLKQD